MWLDFELLFDASCVILAGGLVYRQSDPVDRQGWLSSAVYSEAPGSDMNL